MVIKLLGLDLLLFSRMGWDGVPIEGFALGIVPSHKEYFYGIIIVF